MLHQFTNIWAIDFEFQESDGQLPEPWCAVGKNLRTGVTRTWRHTDPVCLPVYTTGPSDLVIAYAAEAEGKCIRRLGWPMPRYCLDLFPLFRVSQNKFGERSKSSLLNALNVFNLPGLSTVEKEEFRELAIRGAPFTREEMDGLVEYCASDTVALEHLLPKLWDCVALPNALLMGRYTMGAVSSMQSAGIPVNRPLLNRIVVAKDVIHDSLIQAVDAEYGVYQGGSFNQAKFREYLIGQGIPWPRTAQGRLSLDEDTFKSQSQLHPQLAGLADLRKTLAAFRSIKPAVGPDGRNRTSLIPFSSMTGRNQPSNSKFIFGWSRWMRHLAEPSPGRALITLDFEQQEFLIGAVLSRDPYMISAYQSGDPYMHTAILAGYAPKGATKETHPKERAVFKTAVLALQYGCGVVGLGQEVGCEALAKQLIEQHRRLYARYHAWSVQQIDCVLLGGRLTTPFGWSIRKGENYAESLNTRSIANWPVQAAGGDIMRVAAITLVEHGFDVVAPIHDALVVECDSEHVSDVIDQASRLMREASEAVLGGHSCRVEAMVTQPGSGYYGQRVPPMFTRVTEILDKL